MSGTVWLKHGGGPTGWKAVRIYKTAKGAGLVSRWQEGAYSSSRRMAFRCCENHRRNTFWIRLWMFGLWAFAVWAAKWMKDRSTNPGPNRHVAQTPDVFERLMQKEGITKINEDAIERGEHEKFWFFLIRLFYHSALFLKTFLSNNHLICFILRYSDFFCVGVC